MNIELQPLFSILYAVGFGFILIVELAAALTKKSGDTVSDHWWYFIKRPEWRPVLITFYVWLGWHWIIEEIFFREAMRPTYTDDLALIAITAATVAALQTKRRT